LHAIERSGSKRRSAVQGFVRLLWQQALWAVPFALFFGAMFAPWTLRGLWRAYQRMRAELAQAELRALRAQLHPHFLFNTLNSIASLIAIANLDHAKELQPGFAGTWRLLLDDPARTELPVSRARAKKLRERLGA
jgi:hypothetical protein